MTNPLFDRATSTPPFNRLEASHFPPALAQALDEARARAELLKADETPVDFENFILPFENLFVESNWIINIYDTLLVSAKTDAINAIESDLRKSINAFSKDVFQDPVLAARFRAVYDAGFEGLGTDDRQLLERLKKLFKTEGAFLDEIGQARIKAIDEALIDCCTPFIENLNKAALQQALLITDAAELAGLDETAIAAMRKSAEEAGYPGGWLVEIERLKVDAFLTRAHSPVFRDKLLQAVDCLGTQAPYDNAPILPDIMALRHERATLLGYPNYAAFALEGTMAGDAETVTDAIDTMIKKALQVYTHEIELISDFARSRRHYEPIRPCDLSYWANQYRAEVLHFDAEEFSKYLGLEHVLNGFIAHAEKQMGIEFYRNDTVPVFHADVSAYDVVDAQTKQMLGVLLIDPYSRTKTKRGGAWMGTLQLPETGRLNCVALNLNHAKPEAGKQTLLNIKQGRTFFHEGGHNLHGLLGTSSRHWRLQGTNGPADHIEIFSMLQERFFLNYECLKNFARHHETGAPLPKDLFERMKNSYGFFTSFETLRLLQNAKRDMLFHTMNPADYTGHEDLQRKAAIDHPYAEHLRAYPMTRFYHPHMEPLCNYAAGYHGYHWSGMHAAQGSALFEAAGIYDAGLGKRLRAYYAKGVSQPYRQAYRDFAGGDASPAALLKEMGYTALAPALPTLALKHS